MKAWKAWNAWIVLLLLGGATLAMLPAAGAHTCGGIDCGPCVKGEVHQHGGDNGGCSSGPGYIAEGDEKGGRFVPGPAPVAGVVAAALVALALARRAA